MRMNSRLPRKEHASQNLVGLAFLLALAFAPVGLAQSAAPSAKSPEPAKNQEAAQGLSHDLSGVWMQYRDGDVPGTPGMNGVNEHFRPPLTAWGEEQFKNAHALQGNAAVAGKEDNSALRCE